MNNTTSISSIIKQSGSVYLYRLHSDSPSHDISYQVITTLKKIDVILQKTGGCKNTIYSVNIYIRHIEDFQIVNVLWKNWIKEHSNVVPTCIHANMINDSNLVEFTITSACSQKAA